MQLDVSKLYRYTDDKKNPRIWIIYPEVGGTSEGWTFKFIVNLNAGSGKRSEPDLRFPTGEADLTEATLHEVVEQAERKLAEIGENFTQEELLEAIRKRLHIILALPAPARVDETLATFLQEENVRQPA